MKEGGREGGRKEGTRRIWEVWGYQGRREGEREGGREGADAHP